MAGVEASFLQRKGKEKGTPALFFLQMLQSLDRVLQVRLRLSPGFANVEIILQVWHVQREGTAWGGHCVPEAGTESVRWGGGHDHLKPSGLHLSGGRPLSALLRPCSGSWHC